MATFKGIGHQNIGTTPVEVYTVPFDAVEAYDSVVILAMTLTNISGATADATLKIKSGSDEITLINAETLAIGETLFVVSTEKIILEIGDIIEVTSSTATSIDFHMSFMGNDGIYIPPPVWFGDKAVFAGGYDYYYTNYMDTTSIASGGAFVDFGNLYRAIFGMSGTSDSITGLIAGGTTGFSKSYMQRITFASLSNAQLWADANLSDTRDSHASCTDTVHAYFGGGKDGTYELTVIDKFGFSTGGTATIFGDLTDDRESVQAVCDAVFGVFGGGNNGGTEYNIIDYITLAIGGTATTFGTLSASRTGTGSCSDSGTYGLFGGGLEASYVSTVERLTIATTGSQEFFGNLSHSHWHLAGTADGTSGLIGGGEVEIATVDKMIIATTSSVTAFNSLTVGRGVLTALSGD